jgi:hypothetical protein
MNKYEGEATTEQIAEWKEMVQKKFGEGAKVYQYVVEDKVCYVRTVDRATYSAAAAKVSTSPAKFTDVILENCWLGGCEIIKKVDQYYFGLSEFLEELVAKKKGSLTEI